MENLQGGDGILKINCAFCHKQFKYKKGLEKIPDLYEINRWLSKVQCPFCGHKRTGSLVLKNLWYLKRKFKGFKNCGKTRKKQK